MNDRARSFKAPIPKAKATKDGTQAAPKNPQLVAGAGGAAGQQQGGQQQAPIQGIVYPQPHMHAWPQHGHVNWQQPGYDQRLVGGGGQAMQHLGPNFANHVGLQHAGGQVFGLQQPGGIQGSAGGMQQGFASPQHQPPNAQFLPPQLVYGQQLQGHQGQQQGMPMSQEAQPRRGPPDPLSTFNVNEAVKSAIREGRNPTFMFL